MNKRGVLLMIGLLLLALLCACAESGEGGIVSGEPSPTAASPELNGSICAEGGDGGAVPEEPSPIDVSLKLNGSICAVRHPIEEAYTKEAQELDGSTGAMTAFYGKYQELWQEEVEKYQSLICDELADGEDALAAFQADMERWYAAAGDRMETYGEIEKYLHEGGSAAGPNSARYAMELYREKAVELITLYDEIMVGRGWSWANQDWD